MQQYPKYKKGDLQKLEKNLSQKNKKILDDFSKICEIQAGRKKVEKIRREIVQFKDITGKDLDKINKKDVIDFLILLNQSKRSVWTKNEIKIYVKKFLKWFYKDLSLIELIKTESSRDLNPKINENNLVSEEDIKKMLLSAETHKEKAFLYLIFESGGRPQEILGLKWGDVIFNDEGANINLFSNKTKKSRTFPLNKSAKYLKEWKDNFQYKDVNDSDLLFPARRKMKDGEVTNRRESMSSVGLNKILRRLSKKAKIQKDFWNYLFRHTRATRLYEELPQVIVEKLMGHKNMAGVYAHISDKKAREEMLNKVYKINELNTSERSQFEMLKEEVGEMRKLFSPEIVKILKEFREKNPKIKSSKIVDI